MADAPPAAPDGTPAAPAPKPPKPLPRRESQRDRDRVQRNSLSEVEETIKRIGSHRGIVGVLIANGDGIPLKSTLDDQTTLKYAAFITPLAHRAKTITKSHDAKDELTLLRIRTRTNEIIVTSDRDFYLIVAQKTSFLD
ncbi:dynein light chain roadblock-type [Marchantia polymorpha subsp. ruderalis]|uniref:Roadblock/LAMTOR2 domain-containing protein n=2 Tax=Marchantia polymorpha TaxID=3197 RepID=A0AAF6AUF7_MARPO|nr:hypothetical protein MARPO_0002s0256 [Marchantia polymorpha]BBN00078.1 hypothetical protein Mp_1g26210 [Marchantia polymorpha subsp. ruderalis]|eukprot:PTQ49806.1 hypothetical protein MARPO_0002s0256 [Marchantia polymorpha]